MSFWFFKKRDSRENSNASIKALQSSLKASFTNIKQDMGNIGDWIKTLDEKDKEHEEKLKILTKRISILETKLENLSLDTEEYQERSPIKNSSKASALSSLTLLSTFQTLTETQKNLFRTLSLLQKEKGGGWILIKEIANETYPTKSYDAVRSTISDYLSILEEMNLVQRKRVSRQTMVSLTETGQNFVNSIEGEINLSREKKQNSKKKS